MSSYHRELSNAAETARAAIDDFAETLRSVSVGDMWLDYDDTEILAKPIMHIWDGEAWTTTSGVGEVKVVYGTNPSVGWFDKIAPLESIQ